MILKYFLPLLLFSSVSMCMAQDNHKKLSLGFTAGFGSEIKNSDYTHSNNFYKITGSYLLKELKYFNCELIVEPEINFGSHQLLNLYFVQPSDPDYIEKREEYTKLRSLHDYILNIGFVFRKPLFKSASVFVLASVGPMITDLETERLSKGFAFSDVLGLGLSYQIQGFKFEICPTIRHQSNAGFKDTNSGYNTKNIEFGVVYGL